VECGNGEWGDGEWGTENGGQRMGEWWGEGGGEEMGDGGDGGSLPDSINHNFVVCSTSTFRYST
jgi:hypothetical protein